MSEYTKNDTHYNESETLQSSKEKTSSGFDQVKVNRRQMLNGVSGAAVLATTAAGVASFSDNAEAGRHSSRVRRAVRIRVNAAKAYLREDNGKQYDNGDDNRFNDYRASFFKTLPQNNLGEVDKSAYHALLRAYSTKEASDYDAVPLSDRADRKLANPQAAHAFQMTGLDSHSTRMKPAPKFKSALQAAEMGEVYWQALTRDIPFKRYTSDASIALAVADLNDFRKTVGPKEDGFVSPLTLFRGETPGDLVGPYISQLLWLDVPYGPSTIKQRYFSAVPNVDFGLDYSEWLDIQRGGTPSQPNRFETEARYIFNNRSLGEYVHKDVVFQAYLNAALILFSFAPDCLDDSNPYLNSSNQGGFVTFGIADLINIVTKAANVALKGAWYQKWLVHRRLRPEVFAGRIENQTNGTKNYDIHDDIINCDAVGRLQHANNNALLPLAFPEGSPTHPSYPAGHATIAGACATILKAYFNEEFVLPNPVEASSDGLSLDPWNGEDLLVGNEINKLANNVAIGRDAAGVHYRSDGVDGLEVGEQQAIGILRDYSFCYNEDFAGFTFTKFNGEQVTIVNGKVRGSKKPYGKKRFRGRTREYLRWKDYNNQ